jgi:hypothetical protein
MFFMFACPPFMFMFFMFMFFIFACPPFIDGVAIGGIGGMEGIDCVEGIEGIGGIEDSFGIDIVVEFIYIYT